MDFNENDNFKKKYIKYKTKYIKYKTKYIELKKLKRLQKGGSRNDIWIEDNFFEDNKFNKISEYCKPLLSNLQYDERVKDRKTLCLHPEKHKEIYDLIYDDPQFNKYIQSISDKNYKSRPTFPIELRMYPTGSNGMRWHMDTPMFTPNCFEVVLTLENTSDSKFLYDMLFTKEVTPKPNTLAIVKPVSVLHKVTPVTFGYRTILKFIVEFLDENNQNKFNGNFENELKKCPF
jgi:hypothetical protein